jgi:hypothetical protein
MHGRVRAGSRSMAQQTATIAVRLELGSHDGLDGTIGFDGMRSRGVGHRNDCLFFSRRRAARYRNGDDAVVPSVPGVRGVADDHFHPGTRARAPAMVRCTRLATCRTLDRRFCAPCFRLSTGMRRFDISASDGCPLHQEQRRRARAERGCPALGCKSLQVADQSYRVVTSGSGPEVSRQLGVMGVLPAA